MQEAEFQKFVAETIKGITANQKKKKHSNGSFLLEQKTSNFRQCKVYNGKHGAWSGEVFQSIDILLGIDYPQFHPSIN